MNLLGVGNVCADFTHSVFTNELLILQIDG